MAKKTIRVEDLDPKEYVIIKGAAVHNLKKIDVALPRNKFIVITGLSGSGKSSLAFDTLYAEGQRRYVESLSSYARQFIGRMDKPEVDYILGISPAIAIEQKVNTKNPRSTVGTSTEIYDYLKLLFARIGKTYSPVSGNVVKKDNVSDVVDYLNSMDEGSKVLVLAQVRFKEGRTGIDEINILLQKGFSRVYFEEQTVNIDELLAAPPAFLSKKINKQNIEKIESCYIIVDRLVIRKDDDIDDTKARMADSVQTAFFEGYGECTILLSDSKKSKTVFSNRFELDGMNFEIPSVNFFAFNNPYGACKTCEGFGDIIGIDADLVVPDKNLSIYDSAIACWRGEKMQKWNLQLIKNAYKFDFPIHTPYFKLNKQEKDLLWTGNKHFKGLDAFFKYVEEQSYKIQYRVMLSRYRGKTSCTECNGTRLRKDANYVKVAGHSISDLVTMPIDQCLAFFYNIKLDVRDQKVASRLLTEITNRLQYLNDVGLSYLTLLRKSNTLSGGESQRINLATSLGSSLVGSMYILDEPSIGLHPRDTQRLIRVLKSLQELGNTVIIVEHEEEIIMVADELIDIGPLAGTGGGELVFQGSIEQLKKDKKSLTAAYLNGTMQIPVPGKRRKWKNYIHVHGARENNLKNIDVKIPLNVMTAVTGVSGSGKTSLIRKILFPALKNLIGGMSGSNAAYSNIDGDIDSITDVEMIDQNPIGKSSRSNPVTFVKAFDDIRALYSDQILAKNRNYKPSFFSFNVPGGRCEMCQGEGSITIEMQFMADIKLKCETCKGHKFQDEVLEVKYNNKNIYDVLSLTVDEALEFFDPLVKNKYHTNIKRVFAKLKPLADVGLGYITLGQPSSTLSGGEAQRIKLASFLGKSSMDKSTLFLFDEPTTGLHFHDINKLMDAFNALIAEGNTVLIIEHNTEIIKSADWVIDLGPEGGENGGHIVFQGTPENLINEESSYTGRFVKPKLAAYEKAH